MAHSEAEKVFDAFVVNDENNHDTSWVDVHHLEKLSLQAGLLETLSPGDLTLTVFVSPQAASVLNESETGEVIITYDKLLNETGHDSPVASHVFTAAAQKLLSLSPEDSIRSIKVRVNSAATTNATNFWTLTVWLVGQAFSFSL